MVNWVKALTLFMVSSKATRLVPTCSVLFSGKYYIDDLSLMTGKIEDLQKAFVIIEQFCFSFGFKVNINKTEICVFGTRRASTPDVQVYYRG